MTPEFEIVSGMSDTPAPASDKLPPSVPVPPAVPPSVPPAAAAVSAGTKTEAELKTEAGKLETKRDATTDADEKKRLQIKISELEDEVFRLRSVQSGRPVPAVPSKKSMMEKFLSGESD